VTTIATSTTILNNPKSVTTTNTKMQTQEQLQLQRTTTTTALATKHKHKEHLQQTTTTITNTETFTIVATRIRTNKKPNQCNRNHKSELLLYNIKQQPLHHLLQTQRNKTIQVLLLNPDSAQLLEETQQKHWHRFCSTTTDPNYTTTANNNSQQQQPTTTVNNNSQQQQPTTTVNNNIQQQQPTTTANTASCDIYVVNKSKCSSPMYQEPTLTTKRALTIRLG
jgi:hypothetical protein